MKESWIAKVAMGLVVLLVAWNIYKGVTVQEIGIPGFTFKFGLGPTPAAEIEVNGRVVDFDNEVLVSGADVRLTVANTTVSQKTDSAGTFIFKVPGSEGDAVAVLSVTAFGFQPYSENLSQIASMQTVFLKHAPGGAGASSGSKAGGAAVSASVNNKAEQERIQQIAAKLPLYQKRRDSVTLIPHQ